MRELKKTVWRYCAKYIKLRDTIKDFPQTKDLDFVICRTCGKWIRTKSREAQASHFISRGLGGSSGVYFDERNIHICCYQCNAYMQGNAPAYKEFMLTRYGQEVIDELKLKNKTHIYTLMEIEGLKLYYKAELKKLKELLR